MNLSPTLRLNNGVDIPRLGLGVWPTPPGQATRRAVGAALAAGYRHIDTASMYGNEQDVGEAVREAGVPREQVFVTTKLWNSDQGYDSALRAFDASLKKLGLAQVDLYLIHWPETVKRKESWRALERIYEQGKARAIGVSNYTVRHLDELLGYAKVPPAVNQFELSPFLYQRELVDHCHRLGVRVEAYSPLTRGEKLADPRLTAIAARYGRTAAQVLIRWALQHDVVVLPKSARPERIRENGQVFDFELSPEDLGKLDALDEGLRVCWDPTDHP